MPAPATIDEFLGLVRKSQVVDEKALQEFLQRLRGASGVPDSPGAMASSMVRAGLLSHFQAEQLMQGKWRGFFIGRYRILEMLGSGGMGNVFLGEHAHMHRLVAIKVLPFEMAKNPSTLQRFYREARAGAALDHPNIVRSYDIDQNERLHFLAMEYVDGASLQEIVKRHGALAPLRACHYIRQAAHGLQHAHEQGLIHRDIKPGNLLLDRAGTVKILDMGLARFLHDKEDNITRKYDETVLGTADYFSPEQAIDSHTVDIRADIYSLGATFYFLLTGHPPFEEATMVQKLLWHQTKQPKSIKTYRNDVPDGVLAIIDKMMAKKADDRYQTPGEVVAALAPWTVRPIPPPPEHEMPRLSPVVQRAVLNQQGATAPAAAPSAAMQPTPPPTSQPTPPARRESAVTGPRSRPPQPAPAVVPPAPSPADSGAARTAPRPVARPTPTLPASPAPTAPKPSPSGRTVGTPTRPPTRALPPAEEKDSWTPPPKVVAAIVIGCLLLGILVVVFFWKVVGRVKDTAPRSEGSVRGTAICAVEIPSTALAQTRRARNGMHCVQDRENLRIGPLAGSAKGERAWAEETRCEFLREGESLLARR
jgi:serine/threonine protein kinase